MQYINHLEDCSNSKRGLPELQHAMLSDKMFFFPSGRRFSETL